MLQRILDTLKEDLMTRGDFNFEKYITNGIVLAKQIKDKFDFYIHPEYSEDWKVSTSLIFYYQFARDAEQRARENQY